MSSWQHSSSKGFWAIAVAALVLAAGELVAFGVIGRQYVASQAQNLAVLSQKSEIAPEIGYQAALILDPDNTTAHQGLANYYIVRWQPDKAIQSLSGAPNTDELRNTRAKALMELGEAQNASEIVWVTDAERKQLESGGVGKAELLLAKGLPQSALRALQGDSTESARRYMIEASIWMNKPGATKEEQEKSITILKNGIKKHPINLALQKQLHQTYVALGYEEEAQQQLELVQKLEAGKF